MVVVLQKNVMNNKNIMYNQGRDKKKRRLKQLKVCPNSWSLLDLTQLGGWQGSQRKP